MALPKIEYPIFNLTLPSNGKVIKIRPYRVKEEKIMLLARETKDQKQITEAIEQIVRNCVLDDNFDPNKLATFDLDVLLLKLRAISGGETIELRYPVDCEDDKCEKVGHATVNLSDYHLPPIAPPPKIQLSDRIIATLKYPNLFAVRKVMAIENPVDKAAYMLALCIDQIIEDEEVYHAEDYPLEELLEWVETFPNDKYLPIIEFFANIPEVVFNIEFKCKKCGQTKETQIKSIESFFV